MVKKWHISVNNFPAGKKEFPCRVSIPLEKDQKIESFSVKRPDGSIVPAQSRTLVRYSDGCSRWIQIDFTGNGNGTYIIEGNPFVNKISNILIVNQTPEGYFVQTKNLCVKIGKKGFPVHSIIYKNKKILDDENWCKYNVNAADKVFEFLKEGDLIIESSGQNRFQVMWKGKLINTQTEEKLLDVKCRIEFLAGIEGFSLSFQFFHLLEKKPFIDISKISCDFLFPLVNDNIVLVQEHYGNLGEKKIIETKNSVEVFLDKTNFKPFVKDPAILGDFFEYPVFLRNLNQVVGEVFCLKKNEMYVLSTMRDFIHHRPKRVIVRPGKISYDIWPSFAGILNLQQGMSYKTIFDFRFSDESESKEFLDHYEKTYVEPVFCLIEQSDSKQAGATWHQQYLFPEKDKTAGIFSYLLSRATMSFHTISEMFHYGDTPDEGYTQYYASQNRFPPEMKKSGLLLNTSGGIYEIKSNLEPVWSNNEYDAIYCLALETLRTKNPVVLKRLISAARHQIEVDFVHYSDYWQQHHSTPQHAYGHTRTMSSLPSHQWTQGLYHYYIMTGDDDVPEVIKAICDYDATYFDKTHFKFNNFFNREYGWAILALVYGYETTGSQSYIEKAASMIKELEKNTSEDEKKNAFGIGFAQNTVLLGLMAYHQATKEKWARKLFLQWVNYGMKNFEDHKYGPRVTELFIEPLVYACYLTQDKKYLEKSFWHFELFFKSWNNMTWLSGDVLTTKKYARVYRGLVHFVSGCYHANLLKKLEKLVFHK